MVGKLLEGTEKELWHVRERDDERDYIVPNTIRKRQKNLHIFADYVRVANKKPCTLLRVNE